MIRNTILVLAVATLAVSWRPALGQDLTEESLRDLAKRARFFFVMEPSGKKPFRFGYADMNQHIHIYRLDKGRPLLDWEKTDFESRISSLFVADMDHDGVESIVVTTKAGRILSYDARNYDQVFENLLEPFNRITCMTHANIDEDPQDEVIFTDGEFLYIYDSVSRGQEWKSADNYTADEILVANVDDDPQMEIILNTGPVIDSRFYEQEFVKQGTGAFGFRIGLLDLTGDGHPEVIGEAREFVLEVWDIYQEKELW